MKQNKLGILGGMGPKATSTFFDMIVDRTEAGQDQEHIDLVIMNHATLPDRTIAILDQQEQPLLSLIEQDIRLLELAGVTAIVSPCNTIHYFFDQLQAMTPIPIVNMIEETVREAHQRFGAHSKVAVLATDGTIKSDIYATGLREQQMEPYTPSPRQQDRIMSIIYEQVKANNMDDSSELEKLIDELIMQDSCDGVILACTELSCVRLSEAAKKHCIDAMDVLVHKSITLAGKRVKQ